VGRGCTLATVGNGCRLLVSQARDEALDVRETDPPAARGEPEAGFEPATPCLQDGQEASELTKFAQFATELSGCAGLDWPSSGRRRGHLDGSRSRFVGAPAEGALSNELLSAPID
jgi:hypothetical protein